MDGDDKGKRFRLSFNGKEFALFIGGIGVICLLFYLYGLNVGRSRAGRAGEKEVSRYEEGKPASGGAEQGQAPQAEEKMKAPAETTGKPDVPERKPAEGGKGDTGTGGLTFYDALADKGTGSATQPRYGGAERSEGVARRDPKEKEAPAPSDIKPSTGTKVEAAAPEARPSAPGEESERRGDAYTVQVGSYKNWDTAMSMKNRLVRSGHKAYVTQAVGSGKATWFRVRVGHFKGRDEAERLARKIGRDAIVVPVEKNGGH